MHRTRPGGLLLVGTLALASLGGVLGIAGGTASAAPAVAAAVQSNIVQVEGGSTPVDAGLYDAVIKPGFQAAYPQYTLNYDPVGTGQAITTAEGGKGDVVLTHSPAAESAFVSAGYSYEPGGRLVFTSSFVTVGPASDPAGVSTGPAADVVAAFKEIAAAGTAGKADFVSRGDGSGTNAKEEAIWKLTGIPVDKAGEPVAATGSTTYPSWYHKTGQTQGQNLVVTDQCTFSSGACYTLTDIGTYNTQVTNGSVTRLKVLAQNNSGPNAKGGPDLLANPYHAYVVNPAKSPNVNLPGALAFVNYLTSQATQNAIANFPSRSAPAFVPDAYPDVTVTGLPTQSIVANSPVTLTGTVKPNYPLDPPITGVTVQLFRQGDLVTVLAQSTVQADGSFGMAFRPSHAGTYLLFVPQSVDNIVLPGNTGVRQAETITVGTLAARGSTTIALAPHNTPYVQRAGPVKVRYVGTALKGLTQKSPGITMQVRKGDGAWKTASPRLALKRGHIRWSITVSLPSKGRWQARAVYTDPGVVDTAYSHTQIVTIS